MPSICLQTFKSNLMKLANYCKIDVGTPVFFAYIFRYEHIPEKWDAPTQQPYKVKTDLYDFMTEPDAYDHYCVAVESQQNMIQVQFWQNTLPEPTDLLCREVI